MSSIRVVGRPKRSSPAGAIGGLGYRKRLLTITPYPRLTANVTTFCVYRLEINLSGYRRQNTNRSSRRLRSHGTGTSELESTMSSSRHRHSSATSRITSTKSWAKVMNLVYRADAESLMRRYAIMRMFSTQFYEFARVDIIITNDLSWSVNQSILVARSWEILMLICDCFSRFRSHWRTSNIHAYCHRIHR